MKRARIYMLDGTDLGTLEHIRAVELGRRARR